MPPQPASTREKGQLSSDGDEFHYDARGRKIQLKRSVNEYAVRYRAGHRSDSNLLSEDARQLLINDSEHVSFLAPYGLQVYCLKRESEQKIAADPAQAGSPKVERIERLLCDLEREEVVSFVAPIFRRPGYESDPVLTTTRFLAEFKRGVTDAEVDALNRMHHVRIVERLAYVMPALGYLLEAPSGTGNTGPVALSRVYYESGLVRYAEPELIQRRQFRQLVHAVERDTTWLYQPHQWYLDNAGISEAWAGSGTGSAGITIAICDDGVDVTHPEFAGKVVKEFDFENNVASASPKLDIDNHGTACAGVATAAGVNVRGVAPACRLIAARCPAFLGSADEARMFQWMADNNADVISCSWGPPDGSNEPFPVPENVLSAINYCATRGRGGKGIPIFWAAGNGNEVVSSDGYATNPDVMAIAACTESEKKAYYSDFGPEIFLTAPSSGRIAEGDRRIFSVDRQGAAGYNAGDAAAGDAAGDYTNGFGGTSSAAPLVAGVAALMLSVNPALTRDEVRRILMTTADRIGPQAGYDANGHSPDFGYGRVNAANAVAEAVRTAGGAAPTPTPTPTPATPTPGQQNRPQIAAPQSVQSSDGPPCFAVIAGASRFWAVELATRSELFDRAKHRDDRTAENFFASWASGRLNNTTCYTPPGVDWERLARAGRVYYRVISSLSGGSWVDPLTSTSDAEAATAPSIQVGGASAPRTASIQGPPTASRWENSPVWSVSLPTAPVLHYAVEVAAEPNLFDRANAANRNDHNFYASWRAEVLGASPEYQLPNDVWDRLRLVRRLFYRLITSESATSWVNTATTVRDSNAANAPFIALLEDVNPQLPVARRFADDVHPSERGHGQEAPPVPIVVGPETFDRASLVGPAFLVRPGADRFFALEVGADPALFASSTDIRRADVAMFFASWWRGLMRPGLDASGAVSYTLSCRAWRALRGNEALYYRVLSTNSANGWDGLQVSAGIGPNGELPAIVLTGPPPTASQRSLRSEEHQWREAE